MKIVITLPETEPEAQAEYVYYVANQLDEGLTSGHENAERYWSTEEDT